MTGGPMFQLTDPVPKAQLGMCYKWVNYLKGNGIKAEVREEMVKCQERGKVHERPFFTVWREGKESLWDKSAEVKKSRSI